MHRLFGVQALEPIHWAIIVAVNIGLFLLVEAEKAVSRRLSASRQATGDSAAN